jgi:hypothetical protein
MPADSRPALTLTDPVGMGGVIAQAGFDYQIWDGLLRIPASVNNPAFEAVIFEGLENIEAKFFAPHATGQRLLERFQAKSGDLGPKEVGDVFATTRPCRQTTIDPKRRCVSSHSEEKTFSSSVMKTLATTSPGSTRSSPLARPMASIPSTTSATC